MTPRELLDAFDVLADAPDGIKRLRELVLSLAVRGKLVPSGKAKETGHELFRRITAMRSATEGKKPPRTSVQPEDIPWETPSSWKWVRFGEIFSCRLGKMLDKAKNSGDLHPYLRNANVRWGSFDLDNILEMRLEAHQLRDASVRHGDLVICEGGEPGRSAVWKDDEPIVIQKALHRARPILVSPDFYQIHLKADSNSGRLASLFTGATIKHLTGKSLNAYIVALPPLSEQKRIVARVDELMALLDQLEAARDECEDARRIARDAALTALQDAPDVEAAEIAWSRISAQMDQLFTTPEDVGPLRQAVLQLAVRGRLVPQDPSDEPAMELLDRVSKVRGRESNGTSLQFRKEVQSFELPTGWIRVRLDEVCEFGVGVTKGRKISDRETRRLPYLRVANVQQGHFDLSTMKEIDVPTNEVARRIIKPGDVLLTEGGDWDKLGRSAVWEGAISECVHQNHIFKARPLSRDISSYWISAYTNSPDGRSYFQSCAKKTTNLASINKVQLRNTPLPLPPAAEQIRIMAKVDELMALCEDLEAALTKARDLQGNFSSAAVHDLDIEPQEGPAVVVA